MSDQPTEPAGTDWISEAMPPVAASRPAAPPIPSPTEPYQPAATGDSGELKGDGTGGLIPYKNPQALLSYYIGLFSLVPLLGLFMGPAAVYLGVKGLKFAKENPIVKGKAHAWVGIVCGGFWTVVYLGLLVLIASQD